VQRGNENDSVLARQWFVFLSSKSKALLINGNGDKPRRAALRGPQPEQPEQQEQQQRVSGVRASTLSTPCRKY